jgi:hypothetical protein
MGVLTGLRGNPNVSAFGRGQDMQADAERGMKGAQFDMDMDTRRTQQASQERQQKAQLNSQRGQSDSEARTQKMGLDSRMANINLGQAFNYAGLQKRNQMRWQQALVNSMAGE